MKIATIGLMFILGTFLLTGCRGNEKQQRHETAQMAPDFSGTDLSGKKLSLSDFRGKVVLLDFWAPWCPPCRREIPELQKIFEQYKPKGVVVIGVATESLEQLREFKEKMSVSYPLLKVDRKVFSTYQVRGIPTSYVIDQQGHIQYRQVGFAPGRGIEEKFRSVIEKLIAKRRRGDG